MICPDCRRKPWYWASLSHPNEGFLVYICQHCRLLIVRENLWFLADKQIMNALGLNGGVRILTKKLAQRGYTLPPSKQRTPTKEAPSPESTIPARGSRRGG